MEAKLKSGGVVSGKVAELFIKVGVATPLTNELTANQVAEQIKSVTTLEELIEFEKDTRQVVKNAYKKRLKELN